MNDKIAPEVAVYSPFTAEALTWVTIVEQHWPYTDVRDYQETFGGDDRLDEVWKRNPEWTADQLRAKIYDEVMGNMLYLTVWRPRTGGWQRTEAYALANLFARGHTRAQNEVILKGWEAYDAAEKAGLPKENPFLLVEERKLEAMSRDELAAIYWIVTDTFENLC